MKKLKESSNFKMKELFKFNLGPYLTISIDSGKLQLFNYGQKEKIIKEEEKAKLCVRKVSVYFPEEYIEVCDLVENGFFVMVDCEYLNEIGRKKFERNLSIELMQLGTHFERLNDNILLCSADFFIQNMDEPKKSGKIYQFKNYDIGQKKG